MHVLKRPQRPLRAILQLSCLYILYIKSKNAYMAEKKKKKDTNHY